MENRVEKLRKERGLNQEDFARAIRVYEKCGFREYDRREDHVCMETVFS